MSDRAMEATAAHAFRSQFGSEPAIIASAPGRVNLIGEHTDYNDGFVLPCAIDRRVGIALGPGTGRLYSGDFKEERALAASAADSWSDYPSAVAWALREGGHTVPQFDAAFSGNVPLASGLSSSAAIECAAAVALDSFLHLNIPREQLARTCQRAENGFIGVNSGIMDQYASLLCREGAALLIDCRSVESRSVPLDLEDAGLVLLVCDTRVERGLGKTGYNDRRAACERAAGMLGVESLRDATVTDLDRLRGVELQRARHVVTENARVLAAVAALEACNFQELGKLMYASHLSLRDDYEVSVPQLDAFVDAAMSTGALGARVTGAGFGGCAIALVPDATVGTVTVAAQQAYREHGWKEPIFFRFLPSDGAEVASNIATASE